MKPDWLSTSIFSLFWQAKPPLSQTTFLNENLGFTLGGLCECGSNTEFCFFHTQHCTWAVVDNDRRKLNTIQWVGSKVHVNLLLQSWLRDSSLSSWCFSILEAVKWGPLTKISPSVFLLPHNPCLCHLSTYHSLMQTSCHPALFRSWLTLKCPDFQSYWRNRSLQSRMWKRRRGEEWKREKRDLELIMSWKW